MLIELLFSKRIEELTEKDIALFFNDPRTENDKLEFKSYKIFSEEQGKGSKTVKDTEAFKNILTTICAFLNTDGGVLIWGAPEGKTVNGKEKQFYGEICPVFQIFEKDQMINKIASAINPTPNRIAFSAIRFNDKGYVYVFEVCASDFAPHQVKGTYYMRMDGQTRFAPHQYVDGLIRRMQTPRLNMRFNFSEVRSIAELVYLPFSLTILNASRFVNEKSVHLSITTFAQILQEKEVFTGLQEDTKIEIAVAKVLHHGNPIRLIFTLITTLNRGYGRRRIPIYATLSGENSPMVFSSFEIEFMFSESLHTTYCLLSSRENVYSSDLAAEEENLFGEARLEFFQHELLLSKSWENMKNWKPG